LREINQPQPFNILFASCWGGYLFVWMNVISREEVVGLLDLALGAVTSPRFLWSRLEAGDRGGSGAAFCLHLSDAFFPTLTAVMDFGPRAFELDCVGLEVCMDAEPMTSCRPYRQWVSPCARAFPKTSEDVLLVMADMQRQAAEFVAHRSRVVLGARVVVDGLETEVTRIHFDPQNPRHHKLPVVVRGDRRKWRFCEIEVL
jgi:hypothetical protein